ncbi:hypothetical protein AW27_019690 [Streptomyces sp. PCS3-D2]|uniref:hypothetical protein n=1 Tax=Streptomyces sp. PCS3-D2 TaxID=1460244 RepID=UPI0005645ACE|nr:hypothetical protein [Streptomyces sp. PCS3-D2]WKV73547.1 hypothetical protein AW27_019690 [Streptomyces sp. PCS3-D2]
MSAERAQGRGWVRIPASRGEQSATSGPAGHDRPAYPGSYPGPHAGSYPGQHSGGYAGPYPGGYAGPYATAAATDPATIYLSVVRRWREAGRTLPGHPDEEWERLISQPCWPGR